jgi:hypothetical protein
MTLSGGFTIKWTLSIVPLYRGYFIIRSGTETGQTNVFCDWIERPGQPCDVEQTGFYEVGQAWTMYVVAAGINYWTVDVT